MSNYSNYGGSNYDGSGYDHSGYDDQFNDGIFHTSLKNSRLQRPTLWPKSVAEMRQHTSYGGSGMSTDHSESGHSDFMVRRPYVAQQSRPRPQGAHPQRREPLRMPTWQRQPPPAAPAKPKTLLERIGWSWKS